MEKENQNEKYSNFWKALNIRPFSFEQTFRKEEKKLLSPFF